MITLISCRVERRDNSTNLKMSSTIELRKMRREESSMTKASRDMNIKANMILNMISFMNKLNPIK